MSMTTCARCGARSYGEPAAVTIHTRGDSTRYDLCEDCRDWLEDWEIEAFEEGHENEA